MGLKFSLISEENSSWKNTGILFLLGLIILAFSGAAYEEIVNDKTRQIEIIRRKIEENRQNVLENSKILSNLNNSADSIQTTVKSINEFLKDYKDEAYLTADQIARETNTVNFLEVEVNKIQLSFRNKIISLYKHGKNYELELLLSSKTPNEFLRRNQYLQKFAQNRKKELTQLKSKKFILNEKKKMLELSTSSRRFYVESKRNEKARLEESLGIIKEKKREIEFRSKISGEKISRLENELKNVQSFLNNFSDHKDNFEGSKTPRLNYSSENLELIKGTINPPLDLCLIRTEFGRNVNNSTNTEYFSSGIDFSAAEGSKVYSIASGTVTLIGEVPHYGKVIIIDHGNGFRSIYAVLSEVLVKTGDIIKLNQIIARSGSNLEGQSLHFELWKDKTPLNPKDWMRI